MHLFHTSVGSPILIALTVVYLLCEAISTFDTRIIQAKKQGFLPADGSPVPAWTGSFAILGWAAFITLVLLNWEYALVLFVIKFILKVIPVLENIGALLLLPVVGKETASSVNIVGREQKKAAKDLKAIQKTKK